ncbi:hypothetical protein PYCCODRAFT_1465988 [Trametes coccinea BRFM310]|uniref:DH domain-containing protein n=1 Tax=Trametes coccinea (strain BRFM310) TaxID=1353009 RepID=A0A1Y2ITS9_TRAC3|nr:hypothetical protein PYCCODRAFT_1465988 [Trametes coccinea BRFM310]
MSASVDVLPHRPSLLDRRASNNYPDLPDSLSVSSLLAHGPNAHSPAAGPSYSRPVARRPSGAFLPFVPLTPIMASPLLTPELAHAPTPAAVLDSTARPPMSGHDPPQPLAQHQHHHQRDYISHHAPPPNPTWTTSPPTPPSKQPSPSTSRGAASSPPQSPLRAARGRTKSNSKPAVAGTLRSRSASTNRSGPRPASLASYTPTPLSRSYSPSSSFASPKPSASSAAAALSARRLSLPSDLSKPLPPRPGSADGALKELPPVPMDQGSARIDAPGEAETLLPSLSRRAAHAHADAAAVTTQADGASAGTGAGETETGTVRGRAKKLFRLDDDEGEPEGDLSDAEERGRDALGGGQKRGGRERTESGQEMAAVEDRARHREQEKERAERVRRYHALMELLTTEVGYLLDLRVLVTVYLDQLLLLSAPPQSAVAPATMAPSVLPTPPLAQPLSLGVPLPSSGRSMSSGLSALFPSSRSSFFHHSPAPSPSPSTTDFLAGGGATVVDADEDSARDRTRQSSGASTSVESTSRERERERERDKENLERVAPPYSVRPGKSTRAPGPVLTEKDVRAVYRNARELLRFHERFVGELRAAVGLVGFGMVRNGGGDEGWLREMRGDGEVVVSDLVEHAVEVVATKFVNEAAAFSIYETFCPGHTSATDLVRRAQERWPAVWEAYEQRCALLMSRSADSAAPPPAAAASSLLHDRARSDDTAHAGSPVSPASDEGAAGDSVPLVGSLPKTRRHSTPALAVAGQHAAYARPVLSGTTDGPGHAGSLPFPSALSPLSAAALPKPAAPAVSAPAKGPRLKFMDYLIKPVQRICKYPLLLDQLRPKRRDDANADARQAAVDAAVRAAGDAMRGVVARVNSASEKEAHNLRSALIASRITFAHPSAPHGQVQQGSSSGSSAAAVAGSGSGAAVTVLSSAPSAYPPSATPSSSSGSSSSHGHTSSAASSSASSCVSTPATTAPSSATASPGPAALLPLPPFPPITTTTTAPPINTHSPRPAGLTAEFVSSLGPCMLAGALDVLQPASANRAKYLGAFLYAGGYCVLVKVVKGGRAYEPKHWFPLGGVEVVDVEEDDPLFPYSFHVAAYGGHLRLAASCPQEKAIWLAAIADALSTKPSWTNEPLSSFQADEKSPLSPVDDAPAQESPSGLPTIQSLSELEKQSDDKDATATTTPTSATTTPTTPAGGKGQLKSSRTMSRLDSFSLRQEPAHAPQLAATFSAALSRRSSTASVKAFFSSPMSFDPARIARPSAQVRAQVEHGLHDIFSEACLAARAQAQMRGEELFVLRPPASGAAAGGAGGGSGAGGGLGKRSTSGLPLPRSNSGISIANAMGFSAAKRRYDSVLVSRRKSSMDGVLPDLSLPVPGEGVHAAGAEMNVSAGTSAGAGISASASASAASGAHEVSSGSGLLAGRAKTLAARRQKSKPASIAPAITTAIAQRRAAAAASRRDGADARGAEPLSLDSPPAVSHCSSVSSHPGLDSLLPSPTEASPLPLPMPIPVPGASPSGTLRQSDILQARPDAKPKRARSMVSNVRSFFQSPAREDGTSSSSTGSDPGARASVGADAPLLGESPPSEYPTGIVQWLRRTSIRRRDSGSSGSRSTDDHHAQQHTSRRPLPTRSSTDGMPERAGSSPGSHRSLHIPASPGRRVAFAGNEGSTPKRRRSLFVPSSRSRDRALDAGAARDEDAGADADDAPSAHANMPSRRSIKNIFHFQRSGSHTPVR